MVLKKVKSSDLKDLDSCQRIRETAMNLFALKGFAEVSVREIARIACVNVAAVNYYFKSKEKLRDEIMEEVIREFRGKIASIKDAKSVADFAVRFFGLMTENQAMTLNHFKLILDTDHKPADKDKYPVGYEEVLPLFEKELHASVPEEERLWLLNVIMSYVIHSAVMSSTKLGQQTCTKFFKGGQDFFPESIEKLVNGLIRDLNFRYPQR